MIGCKSYGNDDYERIRKDYAHAAGRPASADEMNPSAQTTGHKSLAQGEILSLPKAIDMAMASSPDILMAVTRIKSARAAMSLTGSAYSPYLGIYTEYLQGDAPSAYLFKSIDQRKLAANTDFNNPGWFENWETGLTAGINIYNGGRDRLRREMAAGSLAAANLEYRKVKNLLIATVIQTYYDALAARDYIHIAEESTATVASQLRIMEVRFASGGALKSDILSLRVRLAEAKEDHLRSQNRHRIALTALSSSMGIEPDTGFVLADGQPEELALSLSYSKGLAMALLHRPELGVVQEQVRTARMSIDLANANYRPTLDFKTRYYFDDPKLDYDRERENWTAGFYLNWNLFTGFSTKHKKNQAKAQMEEMLLLDRKTTLSVKADVKQAFLNLEDAGERLKVARSSVETAKESLKLVKQQYEGGSATITRYLEAEFAKSRSMINATAAFYDHQKALAQVARSIGYWAEKDAAAKKRNGEINDG
jgi:outer membrane protein TolC